MTWLALSAFVLLVAALAIALPAALVAWIVARVYDFAMREGRE